MRTLLQLLSQESPSTPLPLTDIALVDKVDWVRERTKDRDVLHVGATDYPGSEFKIEDNTLLHLHLDNCKTLVGLDMSEEGIRLLKEKCNVDNVLCGDAEHLDRYFPEKSFDVIVAGDIIEHLNNVGDFFTSAKKVLRDDGVILVTTPNAFAIKRMLGAIFLRQERNNPDHLYFFSVMTLWQVASRFGYRIDDISTFMYEAKRVTLNRRGNRVAKLIMALTRNHFLADELAVSFRKA